MLLSLWFRLNGNKTFIIALGFTAYAIFGLMTHMLDANAALQIIMTAGIGGAIRHGMMTGAHSGFGDVGDHGDGHCDHDDHCDHHDAPADGGQN